MIADGRLRVGDAERDEVAAQLREHHAVGRIDATELDERLSAVFTARTRDDLAAVTVDLPGPGGSPFAPPRPGGRYSGRDGFLPAGAVRSGPHRLERRGHHHRHPAVVVAWVLGGVWLLNAAAWSVWGPVSGGWDADRRWDGPHPGPLPFVVLLVVLAVVLRRRRRRTSPQSTGSSRLRSNSVTWRR